jgi:protein-disulfide reductase (glutathione)
MTARSATPLLALLLLACEAQGVSPPATPRRERAVATESTEHAPAKSDPIAWSDAIAWRDWDGALRAAEAEQKSICVVVYADWCARCKELAPEFAKPELVSAAAGLIMVRQDQDQRAAWLAQHLGSYGDYVPRVLFLDPHGQVREDLQSGHPRFPYFYAPLVTDRLVANMRAAAR